MVKMMKKGRGARHRNKKRYNRTNKPRKPLALKAHNFCERFEEVIPLTHDQINGSGNLNTTMTKKFSFDMIPQHAAYAALFDEYRIDKVVATFRWSPSTYVFVNSTAAYSGNLSPLLYFKKDYNDDAADSLPILKESMRTHTKNLKYDEPFSISLRPASQILVDANIGNTFSPTWKRWITTTVLDVKHLGLKCQVQVPIDAGTSGNYNMGKITVEYKVYFTVKCNE